jgi:hypothetical protein
MNAELLRVASMNDEATACGDSYESAPVSPSTTIAAQSPLRSMATSAGDEVSQYLESLKATDDDEDAESEYDFGEIVADAADVGGIGAVEDDAVILGDMEMMGALMAMTLHDTVDDNDDHSDNNSDGCSVAHDPYEACLDKIKVYRLVLIKLDKCMYDALFPKLCYE